MEFFLGRMKQMAVKTIINRIFVAILFINIPIFSEGGFKLYISKLVCNDYPTIYMEMLVKDITNDNYLPGEDGYSSIYFRMYENDRQVETKFSEIEYLEKIDSVTEKIAINYTSDLLINSPRIIRIKIDVDGFHNGEGNSFYFDKLTGDTAKPTFSTTKFHKLLDDYKEVDNIGSDTEDNSNSNFVEKQYDSRIISENGGYEQRDTVITSVISIENKSNDTISFFKPQLWLHVWNKYGEHQKVFLFESGAFDILPNQGHLFQDGGLFYEGGQYWEYNQNHKYNNRGKLIPIIPFEEKLGIFKVQLELTYNENFSVKWDKVELNLKKQKDLRHQCYFEQSNMYSEFIPLNLVAAKIDSAGRLEFNECANPEPIVISLNKGKKEIALYSLSHFEKKEVKQSIYNPLSYFKKQNKQPDILLLKILKESYIGSIKTALSLECIDIENKKRYSIHISYVSEEKSIRIYSKELNLDGRFLKYECSRDHRVDIGCVEFKG